MCVIGENIPYRKCQTEALRENHQGKYGNRQPSGVFCWVRQVTPNHNENWEKSYVGRKGER